jgi:methionine biosynthesis protein MetW
MIEHLKHELASRPDLLTIAKIIPPQVRVIDLGCGNGSFLKLLKKEKNVTGLGIECEQESIIACISNGVPVIHSDLDNGLKFVANKSFDYVVLSHTIQAVNRPDLLINEMLRVGQQGIVSFINFGYISARLQLLFKGTMPETKTLPNPWYNTPNTHLATIQDFRNLCRYLGIKIIREVPLGSRGNVLSRTISNIFAAHSVFVITKQ